MKSQLHSLLHVVQGLCKDVQAAYPSLKGLELDLENLSFQGQTRGLSVFTLDLPSLESVLLTALETGRLRLSGPFSRRVSQGVRVPRLFSGLWLRVFDSCGSLKLDADVDAIFFLRALLTLGKKMAMTCSTKRNQSALENYHAIERELRSPSLDWVGDELYVENNDDNLGLGQLVDALRPTDLFYSQKEEEEVSADRSDRRLLEQIQRVADLLCDRLEYFDPVSNSAESEDKCQGIGFRHGRGAVADRVCQWEKSRFRTWSAKLDKVFPFTLCGRTAGAILERPINHEVPSRLLLVPKTAKSPRLIAAESTPQQWCQQILLKWFDDQFNKMFAGSFIDLHDQSKSGEMVYRGSLSRKLATVDLSDASDRISCWTVERIFRRQPILLSALHAARTRYLRDESSRDMSFLKLKKFASQGTATTFPVMSFTLLCVALGCTIKGKVSWDKIWRERHRVRVFGDDIVIPSHGYAELVRATELLQLKVNMAKSYVKGQFRESCGTDGYGGHDVTPVRPKTLVPDSPASCQAVIDTSNNLHNKGLWNAAHSCRLLLPSYVRNNVRVSRTPLLPQHLQRRQRGLGLMDAGGSGMSSFVGGNELHLRKRWNPCLHRYEVLAWKLFERPVRAYRGGFDALLDFFSSKHSTEQARSVSDYASSRKTISRLSWEPSHAPTHGDLDGRRLDIFYVD